MNIAREIGRFLPPGVKGWARYVRGSHEDFYPFGTAMNGQTARLEATREIFYKCQIKLIIETGTFRGTTTEWLARLGAPVISVELHPPSYEFSERRKRHLQDTDFRTALPIGQETVPGHFRL